MPSDVLDKVDELTFDQVKSWISAKKDEEEVKGFLTTIVPEKELSPDIVRAYLDSKDGREIITPILQSEADRRVSEAIKTREAKEKEIVEKEVKRRMAEELLKLNPEVPEWQGRMNELENQIKARDAAYALENLKRQIADYSYAEGLEPFFLESYVPENFEQAKLYVKLIKDRDKKRDEKLRNELIASAGFRPGSGASPNIPGKKLDVAKLSQKEILELEMAGKLDEALEG